MRKKNPNWQKKTLIGKQTLAISCIYFYLRIQYPVLSYSTNEIVVERKYKNNLTISLDDPHLKSFFYSKNIFKAGDAVKTTKR